jgi:hypothetical protein
MSTSSARSLAARASSFAVSKRRCASATIVDRLCACFITIAEHSSIALANMDRLPSGSAQCHARISRRHNNVARAGAEPAAGSVGPLGRASFHTACSPASFCNSISMNVIVSLEKRSSMRPCACTRVRCEGGPSSIQTTQGRSTDGDA